MDTKRARTVQDPERTWRSAPCSSSFFRRAALGRTGLGRLAGLSLVLASIAAMSACSGTTETEASDGTGGGGGAGGQGGAGDVDAGETSIDAGTNGSGGTPSACAQDCSAIQTPPCLVSVCDEPTGQCKVVPDPNPTPCDDGLFCTVDDTCKNGSCIGGPTNDCGIPGDACTAVVCDELSKTCKKQPQDDGTPCKTDDLCAVHAQCKNGLCIGTPKDCFFAPMPDECHVGVCNPTTGKCDPVPGNDGKPCPNDGDLCMVDKTCQNGVCQGGKPKDCSKLTNDCNNGVCDPATGQCVEEPIPPGGKCLDATDECNTGICDLDGTCKPVPTPGVACASATDDCNAGTCDETGQCIAAPKNEGGACNDGNSCTVNDTCKQGICAGTVSGDYVVYFSESFASNAAGWTLGNEWQIGPAKESPGNASYGNEDPAFDHTESADNGIAGVVIGGYAEEVVHGPYCLESPPVDVSSAPGSVYLEFWRWLNSDYTPYMKNTIDAFDGTNWVNVWASGGSPGVKDTAWTLVSHDLTPYKNAALRVRFCFEIGNGGVFTASSWNVDDVVIANKACQ